MVTDKNKCIKENEIAKLQTEYSSNRDLLVELKTLVEKLVQYQIEEAKKVQADHEKRIGKLEQIEIKIVAWASVGGVMGGLIFNLAIRYIK